MPVPLIELQRRLSLVGAIRAGGQKPERGVGRKLEAWRITSAREALIAQAAELYGGDVTQWESPVGREFQVYTERDELPVLVMPNYSLRQTYELWEGATKRTRLCDGVDEELSGGECMCNAEGVDRCDLYTRLVVALPELDTLLGWRVITRGANAAHELPTMIDAARASGATFVPARLRLEQRRGVVDGQVTRFVVPTLDLDVGYAALRAVADPPLAALAAGSASERVEGVVSLPVPQARRAAPFGPESIPADGATPHDVPDDAAEHESEQTLRISDPQKRKLNVLVGTLREQGKITTDGLYDAIATRLRDTAGLDLAATLDGGIDGDGTTHWAPLRDSLTRAEATQLIDWLTIVEARESAPAVADAAASGDAASAAGDEPEAQASTESEVVGEVVAEEDVVHEHVSVPFNEFPPGF